MKELAERAKAGCDEDASSDIRDALDRTLEETV